MDKNAPGLNLDRMKAGERRSLICSIMRANDDVMNELLRATELHSSMRNPHHGYAVILEEVDELWECVKSRHTITDFANMRSECIQIAAMAVRFVIEVADPSYRRLKDESERANPRP